MLAKLIDRLASINSSRSPRQLIDHRWAVQNNKHFVEECEELKIHVRHPSEAVGVTTFTLSSMLFQLLLDRFSVVWSDDWSMRLNSPRLFFYFKRLSALNFQLLASRRRCSVPTCRTKRCRSFVPAAWFYWPVILIFVPLQLFVFYVFIGGSSCCDFTMFFSCLYDWTLRINSPQNKSF